MDRSTELLSDGANPVLCWGERCLVYRDHVSDVAPRPAVAAGPVPAVVGADRVCTGTRCDRLGPRLCAAVADVSPEQLSATRDHAAIVISGGAEHTEIWNRAADRRVELGEPRKDEGEVDAAYVIGDRVIVARSCNEYCSAIGSIVDARGRRRGGSFAVVPEWDDGHTRIVAVTTDRFLVFGGFGELAMIDHGRAVVTTWLVGSNFMPEGPVDVQAVRLDDQTVAARWCVHDMCHLTRIRLFTPEAGMPSPELDLNLDLNLDLVDEQVLPACTR